MASPHLPTPLRIGVHASLAPSAPEVSYTLRTLFALAGYPYELLLVDEEPVEALDVYYGPAGTNIRAPLVIRSARRRFSEVCTLEPRGLVESDGLPWLDIGEREYPCVDADDDGVALGADIVLSSFWMLSGASEPRLRRDRRDDLLLDDAFVGQPELLRRPIVSLYGDWLRRFFQARGHEPLLPPWASSGTTAFAFSHDVNYPEIVRAIESARVLYSRGVRGLPLAARVLAGRSHFWTFREWMAFERALDARGAFYFMARRGSLLEYAMGTPDGFYDVRARRFRDLFAMLRDQGFEIGLHASYHAHGSLEQLRTEKHVLEDVVGAPVRGNRHRSLHLDPRRPYETLAMHETARFQYDSSLAFGMHPGFRRGICHPFRPYHPKERRAIRVVQLPPAWMDDHFDRRRAENGVAEPNAVAATLLGVVRATGGVAVVNHRERGMNADFFPGNGQWLGSFLRDVGDDRLVFYRPADIADMYETHERMIETRSRDRLRRVERVPAFGAP